MSQYIQLLGTDTPNGFGGCCYYGTLDHPGLQIGSSLPCPPSLGFSAPATYQNLLQLPLETAMARLGVSSELDSKGCSSSTVEEGFPINKNTLSKKSPMSVSGSEGYLFFNCPEGTQRFSSEANIKLTKIKGFFFTRWGGKRQKPAITQPTSLHHAEDNKDTEANDNQCGCKANDKKANTSSEAHDGAWDTLAAAAASAGTAVMGLPGLLFTINDAGVQHVNIFGPSSAQLALQAWLSKMDGDHTPGTSEKETLVRHMAGLEQFLVALRVSYFSYRPMVFRMLTPTFPPFLSVLKKAIKKISCGTEQDVSTSPVAQCLSLSPSTQKAEKPTAVPRNETFLLPPPPPALTPLPVHMELGGIRISFDGKVPFIVAVLPLSSQSVLIAFRVSGEVVRNHINDAHIRNDEEEPREGASAVDAGDVENTFSEFLPDLSELVLGYAIVSAPQPAFDASRARALGVLPGPKYAQLKQGIAVYADTCAGEGGRKISRRTRRAGEGTASLGGISAEKHHRSSHTGCDSGARDGGLIFPNAEAASAPPAQRENPELEPKHQTRLVEPYEVTFPTMASQHLYVSLVLDGNRATDVRAALERLLGACDRKKKETLEGLSSAPGQTQGLSSCDDLEERTVSEGDCGELIRVLTQSFPNLAYTSLSDSSDPNTCGSEQKRKLRTVVIRHVVHVQPLSYFKLFDAGYGNCEVHKRGFKTPPEAHFHPLPLHESVYQRYLSTIFGTVHHSVKHSCSPMFSFTMADLLETDISAPVDPPSGLSRNAFESTNAQPEKECTGGNARRPSRPDLFTKHLFTAFVQKHFTAFPTALVHRYHLHAIAPGGFPVPAHARGGAGEVGKVGEAASGPFWPYSLKLHCVPPHHACPALASPLAIHTDGGGRGGTQCIRYPDPPTAQALLSAGFRAILRALPEERAAEKGEGGGALGFLGTGSAVPSKYRNVSGAYLELHLPACCFGPARSLAPGHPAGPDLGNEERQGGDLAALAGTSGSDALDSDPPRQRRGVVILDFGEGSLGQLSQLLSRGSRRCRVDSDKYEDDDVELSRFVLDVEVVFISHGHADHHLGLLSFLSLRHFYLEYRRVTRWKQQPQRDDHEFDPFVEHEAEKLLIVLPEEVYEFMNLSWFTLWPYNTWIEQECEFDIIPSMGGAVTYGGFAGSGVTPENAAVGLGHGSVPTMQGGVGVGEVAFTFDGAAREEKSHRQRSESQAPLVAASGAMDEAMTSEVTCLPRLRARLMRWNDSIASHFGRPRVQGEGLWDARVLKVDHPANAHALLLRFPFSSSFSSECGGGGGLGVNASQVLLFSGDTRPCPFLVAQCRFFCAHQTHSGGIVNREKISSGNLLDARYAPAPHARPDASARALGEGYTVQEGPGPFICLHEATFGPGFEAEAISKKHSTLPEALDIGAQTWSEFVVLNHFSQRYPKLPGQMEGHLKESVVDVRLKRSRTGSCTDPSANSLISSASLEQLPKEFKRGDDGYGSDLTNVENSVQSKVPSCPSPKMYASGEEYDQAAQEVIGRNRFAQGARQRPASNVCFAFDLMRLSFSDLCSGSVASRLPIFVRLLEEYETWEVGTTQRLRDSA